MLAHHTSAAALHMVGWALALALAALSTRRTRLATLTAVLRVCLQVLQGCGGILVGVSVTDLLPDYLFVELKMPAPNARQVWGELSWGCFFAAHKD